jgi:hypothetical protein
MSIPILHTPNALSMLPVMARDKSHFLYGFYLTHQIQDTVVSKNEITLKTAIRCSHLFPLSKKDSLTMSYQGSTQTFKSASPVSAFLNFEIIEDLAEPLIEGSLIETHYFSSFMNAESLISQELTYARCDLVVDLFYRIFPRALSSEDQLIVSTLSSMSSKDNQAPPLTLHRSLNLEQNSCALRLSPTLAPASHPGPWELARYVFHINFTL